MFDEEDIKGALEPAEKELQELKLKHADAVAFFSEIDREDDDDAIIKKFEAVNVREDFEYAFKMFSKALDVILPEKEAEPYIPDFKYLSRKRQMIRNLYESPGTSLKVDGRKVQQLIDDHIRSLNVSELVKSREVTDENFLVDILKFKSDRARTALVKNRAKLVIKELASHNPVYYERLRERLEKIIREEEQRRKQNANYFNNYKEILQEALEEDKERKKLGFSNLFEFAVYEELLEVFKDKKIAKDATRKISSIVNDEIQIVGWKKDEF
jgi:type I restriction enzyme, R subunit